MPELKLSNPEIFVWDFWEAYLMKHSFGEKLHEALKSSVTFSQVWTHISLKKLSPFDRSWILNS